MKTSEKKEKAALSLKVKEAVKNLNAAVIKARNNGLIIELKTDSCVMAEGPPPLQIRVFEQLDY